MMHNLYGVRAIVLTCSYQRVLASNINISLILRHEINPVWHCGNVGPNLWVRARPSAPTPLCPYQSARTFVVRTQTGCYASVYRFVFRLYLDMEPEGEACFTFEKRGFRGRLSYTQETLSSFEVMKWPFELFLTVLGFPLRTFDYFICFLRISIFP